MEKINIAELLKDCPQGMELYSPLCGKCVFDRLNMGTIICKKQNTQEITFTSEGYYMIPVFDNCECMIFPSKDQRDWSKFQRPFKDGDIVITTLGDTAIIKEPAAIDYFAHCILVGAHLHTVPVIVCVARLATEEEKQEIFQIIKDKGYKWNEKTKTLEKLVEPKFAVGDRVIRTATHETYVIDHITSTGYVYKNGGGTGFIFEDEHLYELAPNKFDITTLKPFESRVLVRDSNNHEWRGHFFSHYNNCFDKPYICIGIEGLFEYKQCIPYEGNEHLLGKTDDCDEFYKTWE